MKCEKCDSDLEILAEGGRYTRFGWFPSRSYRCPNCKAVYELDGFQLVEVRGYEQTDDTVIRKVKVLKGRAKDEAMKLGLDPDDLVIVTVTTHPLPEYHLEKVKGAPVSFLLSQIQSSEQTKKEEIK